MWEINSRPGPPTGRPAAPEGRHSNQETLLENLLSKMEAAATGFQEAGNDSRAPWGWKSKERMCFGNNLLPVQEPVTLLSRMW